MIFNVLMFMTWFSVWILLSWPVEIKDIISGILVSAFVTLMTTDVMRSNDSNERSKIGIMGWLVRSAWFIYYVFVFLWECLKANIDVAYRVIHPDLPIRPGTIRVKLSMKSDVGLTFLANSITLTPGTTSIDIDKDRGFLYVHKLYVKDDERSLVIVDRFEKILSRIFE